MIIKIKNLHLRSWRSHQHLFNQGKEEGAVSKSNFDAAPLLCSIANSIFLMSDFCPYLLGRKSDAIRKSVRTRTDDCLIAVGSMRRRYFTEFTRKLEGASYIWLQYNLFLGIFMLPITNEKDE